MTNESLRAIYREIMSKRVIFGKSLTIAYFRPRGHVHTSSGYPAFSVRACAIRRIGRFSDVFAEVSKTARITESCR